LAVLQGMNLLEAFTLRKGFWARSLSARGGCTGGTISKINSSPKMGAFLFIKVISA